MVTNSNPFTWYALGTALKESILPYLALTEHGEPDRACVHAGEIAWDECECGQLTVSLQTAFPSNTFPTPSDASGLPPTGTPTNRGCGSNFMVFTFLVSMLRCAPIGEDNAPPSCADLDAAASVTAEDAWAVRAGLHCYLTEAAQRDATGRKIILDWLMGTQVAVGPDGMCQGTEIPVTIAVPHGCYPCETES